MRYETIATTSEEEFIRRGTDVLADAIRDAIDEQGRCVIGLSGGSTPRPIYAALARAEGIDWYNVWLFLIDERMVPKDDPRSNQFLLRSTLLAASPIPESQIVVPDTSLPVEQCASNYNVLLGDLMKTGVDIVTLGMGDDGHIASLFPPVSDLAKGPELAMHTLSDRPDTRHRISVTLPVLTAAKHSFFFLRGEDKKATWETMMKGNEDWHRWPAKAVLHSDASTVVSWW